MGSYLEGDDLFPVCLLPVRKVYLQFVPTILNSCNSKFVVWRCSVRISAGLQAVLIEVLFNLLLFVLMMF
jgi:hypothetical protein